MPAESQGSSSGPVSDIPSRRNQPRNRRSGRSDATSLTQRTTSLRLPSSTIPPTALSAAGAYHQVLQSTGLPRWNFGGALTTGGTLPGCDAIYHSQYDPCSDLHSSQNLQLQFPYLVADDDYGHGAVLRSRGGCIIATPRTLLPTPLFEDEPRTKMGISRRDWTKILEIFISLAPTLRAIRELSQHPVSDINTTSEHWPGWINHRNLRSLFEHLRTSQHRIDVYYERRFVNTNNKSSPKVRLPSLITLDAPVQH